MSVQSNLKSFLLSKSKGGNEQSTSEKVDFPSESEGTSSDIKYDAKSSSGPSYPSIGVDPSIPRRAGRQAHRNNVPADTTSQYWKLSLFYPFVDHVMQELRDRLLGANARYIAQYLVPTQLRGLSDEKIRQLYDSISDDLDMSLDDFNLEIRRWRARWSLEPQQNLPGNLKDTLQVTNKDLYPGTYKALLILITIPVSTASAERSFSVMRRLKTYLRATMTTERLSGLALLHAHKDMNIDRDAVIQRFAEGKSRRLLLLFQV
ncbi:hypothetical protein FSP39_010187 [Pinctada imbricata]|uniref:HAT C-terminal dimerisation domain-containing protein n=1 Tax=Pinctada imbricata TaxID=66713 RepID=A0AA89BZ49_PINIB|nr:hypothetical protein FSP39_010187 [Pinctada imbricata]